MRTTTIRELKHDTTTVLARVAAGETIEVLRRNVPVAVLTPPRSKPLSKPDFGARLRAIYGNTVLSITATELVGQARGEW